MFTRDQIAKGLIPQWNSTGSHAILEGTKGGSFFCFFCEVRDKSKDLRIGKIMENHLCSSPFGYLSVVFETFELLPCCQPWDFSCPWQDRSEANLQFFPIRCVETLLRACRHNLCQVPLDAQACDGVHLLTQNCSQRMLPEETPCKSVHPKGQPIPH